MDEGMAIPFRRAINEPARHRAVRTADTGADGALLFRDALPLNGGN